MASCTCLILHCMDFRLQSAVEKWVRDQGFEGDADRISFAGACKEKELALANINLSVHLHHINTVVLTQHEDCGAYGGQAEWDSPQAEKEALVSDMMDLKRQVLDAHPDLAVTTVWIGRSGEVWSREEIAEE